jgi:hypothetical protein
MTQTILAERLTLKCESLERERDELQKAVNGLCNHLQVSPANTTLLAVEILKIVRERDEARAEMIRWQSIAEGRGRTDDDTSVCQELNDANERMGKKLAQTLDERDRLAEVINAATILIAAKGRHNTMLAYEGLRETLQSLTPNATA